MIGVMMTTASASRQLARGLVRTIGDEPGRTTIVCSSLATLETLTTLARQNRGLSLFIQQRSDRYGCRLLRRYRPYWAADGV